MYMSNESDNNVNLLRLRDSFNKAFGGDLIDEQTNLNPMALSL